MVCLVFGPTTNLLSFLDLLKKFVVDIALQRGMAITGTAGMFDGALAVESQFNAQERQDIVVL